ncbi:phosphotransferase [Candidatus Bathyarchaeota archaeon]|nr:phosphotransferase [Candidatus Bathyarchaeota archaeon]
MKTPLAERLQEYLNLKGLEGLAPPGGVKLRELRLNEKQGLSNKTFLLKVELEDGSVRDLILRMYVGDGKKASKEFRVLKFLHRKGLPVPMVYLIEDDGKVLGKPFIVMEKITPSPAESSSDLVDAAAKSLAEIHGIDRYELEGVLEVKEDYPSRDLKGIKAISVISALSTLKSPLSFIRYLKYAGELERTPVEARLKLIHGDYGFDNIIYSGGRAYVIDWEDVDVAEPTYDVAYAYNFLDFEDRVSGRSEDRLSDEFLEAYERYGGTLRDFQYYRRLAALKLLVIFDAVMSPGLIALIAREFRKIMKNREFKLFIGRFKEYLMQVLKKTS